MIHEPEWLLSACLMTGEHVSFLFAMIQSAKDCSSYYVFSLNQHRVLRSKCSKHVRTNASSRHRRGPRIQRRRSSISIGLRRFANYFTRTQVIEPTINTKSFGKGLSSFRAGGTARVADCSAKGSSIVNNVFFYDVIGVIISMLFMVNTESFVEYGCMVPREHNS